MAKKEITVLPTKNVANKYITQDTLLIVCSNGIIGRIAHSSDPLACCIFKLFGENFRSTLRAREREREREWVKNGIIISSFENDNHSMQRTLTYCCYFSFSLSLSSTSSSFFAVLRVTKHRHYYTIKNSQALKLTLTK